MEKLCKHSKCAVCRKESEREIFSSIFQTSYPDLILCKDVKYKITNLNGGEFILPLLEEYVIKRKGKYFVQDIYSSRLICLDKNNFKIICTNCEECSKIPEVKEYNIS